MSARGHFPLLLCLLLCLANLGGQWAVNRAALNDSAENLTSPSSTDTRDYLERARILAGKDVPAASNGSVRGFTSAFATAFADGYRTPGYPLFLAAFQGLPQPLKAARVLQTTLSALTILAAFLALRNAFRDSGWPTLAGAAGVAAWLPLHHYAPILLAETCSIFVFSLLLWVLSRGPGRGRAVLAALLTALLVFLKPNHFILLLPVGVFLGMNGPSRGARAESKRGARREPAVFVLLALALILPWSAFVSLKAGRPVLLTTASDTNLMLGTGVMQEAKDAGTLPYRFASRWIPEAAAAPEAIWKTHPLRTSLYGVTKVLHGFGFSLRGPRDLLLAFFTLAALFFSARVERNWRIFFWILLAVTAFQLFLYLPNQRLKTVLFDLPALLILTMGLRGFVKASQRSPDEPRG